MAVPVIERIATKIVERIEQGTYTKPWNIKEVIRPTRQHRNYVPEHLVCIVQQAGGERAEQDAEYHGNPYAISFKQPFGILVWVRPSDDSKNPVDQIVNYVAADLIRALTTSTSDWAQWDGLATNSDYTWQTLHGDNESVVSVELNVTYRHSSEDPYVQR